MKDDGTGFSIVLMFVSIIVGYIAFAWWWLKK